MYSGFKLTKTGQVWKNRSTVFKLPLLDISLRNTEGVAVRSSKGTYILSADGQIGERKRHLR